MILSGKYIADILQKELKEKISLNAKKPCLAVILVGSHPASQAYVERKKKACSEVGISSPLYSFPESISEKELLEKINELNCREDVHGILVQLPLPSHIDQNKIMENIHPKKDVDGFHPINMGKLMLGLKGGFIPCTPLGIKTLLERYKIPVSGKHVVIVGRSNIVGKPLAALLMQKEPSCNATVTVVHSQSTNLASITKTADILVAAIGSPRFVKANMIKEGACVIDVGINREENAKGMRLVGDVDFESVEKKCSAITPVPKGVGPMTVAMLLNNTYLASIAQ